MRKSICLFAILALYSAMHADTLQLSNAARKRLQHVLNGGVENVKVKINDPESLIAKCYGKPIGKGWLSGGEYYKYKDKLIFVSDSLITSILLQQRGAIIGGINIGTTLSEIKAILGEPSFYGYASAEEGEEIYPDQWVLEYTLDRYCLFFVAKTKTGRSTSGELRFNFNAK